MPSENGEPRASTPELEGLCARTVDYLVEGGNPPDHGEMKEHLASCLACFRMRADLADLPELFARVRALSPVETASERGGDPAGVSEASDAAFWDSLPSQIADAVLRSRASHGLSQPLARAAARDLGGAVAAAPVVSRRKRAWLALPLTLAAAALIGYVGGAGRPLDTRAGAPTATKTPGSARGEPRQARLAPSGLNGPAEETGLDDADVDVQERADDESALDEIANLDTPALRSLARSLGRSAL